MCDFTTMLKSTVQRVERDLVAVLNDIGIDVTAQNLNTRLNAIFHSQEIRDPFCGLQTQYQQKRVFTEKFHLLVRYY